MWSLNAYSLTNAPLTPVPGNPQCFRFGSLGMTCRCLIIPSLWLTRFPSIRISLRLPSRSTCRPAQPARPVPRHQERPFVYYGVGESLALFVGSSFRSNIKVCNLTGPDGSWDNMPAAGDPPAIDPELGRVAFPPSQPSGAVSALFYYGFNADMGGGEYPRAASFPPPHSLWCGWQAARQPRSP